MLPMRRISATLERGEPAVTTVEAVAPGVSVEVCVVTPMDEEPGAAVVCAAVVGVYVGDDATVVVTGKLVAGYDPICDPPEIPEIPDTDMDPTPPPSPWVAQLQTDDAPSMTAW